jgi:hypothetical protein
MHMACSHWVWVNTAKLSMSNIEKTHFYSDIDLKFKVIIIEMENDIVSKHYN